MFIEQVMTTEPIDIFAVPPLALDTMAPRPSPLGLTRTGPLPGASMRGRASRASTIDGLEPARDRSRRGLPCDRSRRCEVWEPCTVRSI